MKVNGTEGMKIFEPFDIGSMHLKNRIGIGPYGTHPCDPDTFFPNDATAEYYRVLAETGVGLVMVGITEIMPDDKRNRDPEDPQAGVTMPRIDCDETIEGWRKVTNVFHENGCSCGVQLGMFGYVSLNYFSEIGEQYKKYAYHKHLSCDTEVTSNTPQRAPFTKEYLEEIIYFAGQAARRAKEAGFDCVEVHAAHSDIMLTACSMDPMFNNRDDEYGGPIEGRLRFPTEMIKEMKKQTGGDFPVLFRINGDDLKGELGNTNEDICKYIVPELEKAGLDAFDISMGGNLYAPFGNLPCGYYPRAAWMHLPAAVKKVTDKPIIGVARVLSIEMAEKVVREGMCDVM
jgi:2,4-dienoyl-CoA reductase-like NADH-dependent reductase (Old Yellow Enzyme family)